MSLIKIAGYAVLILASVTMLMPFFWMLGVSLMSDAQVLSLPPQFIPKPFVFSNYSDVADAIPLPRYFFNSLIVAVLTTVGQVAVSAMAGYAFARNRYKYKEILFFLILITMMIPPQINIIPLFFLMRELGWIDTYQVLIVPGLFGGFGVFMMRQWFKSIPKDLEESAQIDGCNSFHIFFKIALPLAAPVIVTLGIFTFISSWNSFMWPLITTNSDMYRTLPVGLAIFKGSFREVTQWSALMACSVISCAPVVLIFLLGKKYFINDLLLGSLKE